MNPDHEFSAIARAIIAANLYLVLGTADAAGRPWVTPVYFSADGYQTFYWASSLDAQHSRNLAVRPQVSLVIYNSQAPIYTGQAVYMTALAAAVAEPELDAALALYSHAAVARGGRAWAKAEAVPPSHFRLFRATASEQWILDPTAGSDQRVLVKP